MPLEKRLRLDDDDRFSLLVAIDTYLHSKRTSQDNDRYFHRLRLRQLASALMMDGETRRIISGPRASYRIPDASKVHEYVAELIRRREQPKEEQ